MGRVQYAVGIAHEPGTSGSSRGLARNEGTRLNESWYGWTFRLSPHATSHRVGLVHDPVGLPHEDAATPVRLRRKAIDNTTVCQSTQPEALAPTNTHIAP
eukprot:3716513-Pleurochrysis_carterae.AAC.1